MTIYVVTYENKEGLQSAAYSTEAKAWAALDALKAAHPEDFDEDDARGWWGITPCPLDP